LNNFDRTGFYVHTFIFTLDVNLT